MNRGRVLALDTPDALRQSLPGASALEVQLSFPFDADVGTMLGTVLAELRALPAVERVEQVTRALSEPPPGMQGMGGSPPWAGAGAGGPPPGAADTRTPSPSTTPVIRLYAALPRRPP